MESKYERNRAVPSSTSELAVIRSQGCAEGVELAVGKDQQGLTKEERPRFSPVARGTPTGARFI